MDIKVSDALRDMLLNGPVYYSSGICTQVTDVGYRLGCNDEQVDKLFEVFHVHKREAILDWPEALDINFPVPSPKNPKSKHAADVAYWTNPLWQQNTYGNSRRRLLRHLIIWFKERGM